MAIKKSQLFNKIWKSANELRTNSKMDPTQFKDYVLLMLFLKYISAKDKIGDGLMIHVPEGCTFDDFVLLRNQKNIGEQMDTKMATIAKEFGLTDIFGEKAEKSFNNPDKFGSGQDLIDHLSALIDIFNDKDFDLSKNRADNDDLMGDTYEFLMRNFAQEGGKSKGQFYTPAEASRLIAQLIGIADDNREENIDIYDPTCGSGSLLLRAYNEVRNRNASLNGQERDLATYGIARLNMILHNVWTASLKNDDTIKNPLHKEDDTHLTQFDYVVANPPFSQHGWRAKDNLSDPFNRWSAKTGVPPPLYEDLAFLMHIIRSTKADGKSACILPHGVLFRGGEEAKVRKWLVSQRFIKGIVGLPPNLFFGTPIAGCIIVIDKSICHSNQGIYFINASEGFEKDGDKNRLRERDIKKIMDAWKTQENIPHFARFVKWDELEGEKNNSNLNIARYVPLRDREIIQDLDCHINGGIPSYDVDEQMQEYWEACATLKETLFCKDKDNDKIYQLKVGKELLRDTIFNDESFKAQASLYNDTIEEWAKYASPLMRAYTRDQYKKDLIKDWGQKLQDLVAQDDSLVSCYAPYDQLLNYWNETLLDDLCWIDDNGWNSPIQEPAKAPYSYRKLTSDLLPVDVIIREFFKNEVAEIERLEHERDEISSKIDTLIEENEDYLNDDKFYHKLTEANVARRVKAINIRKPLKDEEDILKEAVDCFDTKGTKEEKADRKKKLEDLCNAHNDIFGHFDKVNKSSVNSRLKDIPCYEYVDEEEREIILQLHSYMEDRQSVKNIIKFKDEELYGKLVSFYNNCTTGDFRDYVVYCKWIYDIKERCFNEMKNVTQEITTSIIDLSERYEETISEIENSVSDAKNEVNKYLNLMGIQL